MQALIERTGGPGGMVTDACLANQGVGARDRVQPARSAGAGILAVDVPARAFEETGVGMKCEVNEAMTVLFRKGDELREYNETVAQTTASARNGEQLGVAVRPPGG